MKKRIVVVIALVLLPTLVWCMEEKEVGHGTREVTLRSLKYDPTANSTVIIKYEGQWQLAHVKNKLNTGDFAITQTRDGKSHGLLLPLSALYELVQKEEK